MRKIYLLIAIICVAFATKTRAQSSELVTVVDSLKEFDWSSSEESWELYKTTQNTYAEDGTLAGYIEHRDGKDYRYTYNLDEHGNQLNEIKQNYVDSIDTWVNYSNYIKTFDADNNVTSYYSVYWDEENENWYTKEDTKKTITEYDSMGQVINKKEVYWIAEEWVETKTWTYKLNDEGLVAEIIAVNLEDGEWIKSSSNVVYEYDSTGNLTTETWYKIDSLGNYTIKYTKYIHVYDELGQEIEYLNHRPNDDDEWAPYRYYYHHTYDENGNEIERMREKANDGVYSLYDKTIYTYDDNNNLISQIEMDANDDKTDFVNDEKTTYEYDAEGNQIRVLTEVWEDSTWVVDEEKLVDYQYDLNGELVAVVTTELDEDIYVNVEKTEYYLSSDVAPVISIVAPDSVNATISFSATQAISIADSAVINAISIASENGAVDFTVEADSLQRNFVITPVAAFEYNVEYTITVSGAEGLYNNAAADASETFEFVNTGITTNSTTFKVFPNPATSFITISGEASTYSMYNTTGAIVKEGVLSGSTTISTSDLKNGLYFINFENAGNNMIKKVVIRK